MLKQSNKLTQFKNFLLAFVDYPRSILLLKYMDFEEGCTLDRDFYYSAGTG